MIWYKKKLVMPRIIFAMLLALCIILMTGVCAISRDGWQKDGDFGLGIVSMGPFYPIITFIPTGCLLFDIDLSKEIPIEYNKYIPVVTQDGVKLYAPRNKIYTQSVNDTFGSASIIFNSSYRICISPGCNSDLDSSTIQIYAGSTYLHREVPGIPDFYQVIKQYSDKSEDTIGVITKEQLGNLEVRGILTRIDSQYPKYAITRKNAIFPNTECGMPKQSTTRIMSRNDLALIDEVVLNVFKIGTIEKEDSSDSITLKIPYSYGGEGNRCIKYFLYEVYNMKAREPSLIAVQVKYQCSSNISKPMFIENVSFIQIFSTLSDNKPLEYSFKSGVGQHIVKIGRDEDRPIIELSPGDTPRNLWDYMRYQDPYMYSVNTVEQYYSLISYLGEKFNDHSLAAFFLAEFNRSCRDSYRRNNTPCNAHNYKAMSNNSF